MPITPLSIWKKDWDNLPFDEKGTAYPSSIASFLSNQLAAMTLDPAAGGLSAPWTFASSVFRAAIVGLKPDISGTIGPTAFADAFESSVLASTMIGLPGSFVGSPAPPTLFSVVSSTIIDAPIVSSLKSDLLDVLLDAPPAELGDSIYPIALREAFSSITYTLSGLNSIPIPTSLVGPGFPVV